MIGKVFIRRALCSGWENKSHQAISRLLFQTNRLFTNFWSSTAQTYATCYIAECHIPPAMSFLLDALSLKLFKEIDTASFQAMFNQAESPILLMHALRAYFSLSKTPVNPSLACCCWAVKPAAPAKSLHQVATLVIVCSSLVEKKNDCEKSLIVTPTAMTRMPDMFPLSPSVLLIETNKQTNNNDTLFRTAQNPYNYKASLWYKTSTP